jgi:hypothetical protein
MRHECSGKQFQILITTPFMMRKTDRVPLFFPIRNLYTFQLQDSSILNWFILITLKNEKFVLSAMYVFETHNKPKATSWKGNTALR